MNLKRYLTFVLLTILAFSAAVMAQSEESADEAAIRQNIKYLEDGWTQKAGRFSQNHLPRTQITS